MSNNTFGLIVDTSQKFSFIVLSHNEKALDCEKFSKEENGQLEEKLTNFLFKNSVLLKNLSYLALGIGPGSFTGLRLGYAMMQGLKLGLSIPLFSFYSLEAYFLEKEGKTFILSPAYAKKAYLQEIDQTLGVVDVKTPRFLSSSDLLIDAHWICTAPKEAFFCEDFPRAYTVGTLNRDYFCKKIYQKFLDKNTESFQEIFYL